MSLYYFSMYDTAGLYDLTQALSGAIFGAAFQQHSSPRPSELPPLLRLRQGRAESPGWFLVQALEFDPEPISVSNLRVRDIYASNNLVFALLELMASEKWLEPAGGEAYRLTTEGRAVIARRNRRKRQAILSLQANLEQGLVERLAKLLGQVISASLGAPDPPGTWCLRHSRNRAPGPETPPLLQIIQYGDDFNAFRDDAHMAAWQPEGIDGYTWEAFAFVHDGAADTAKTIDRLLYYRGYSRHDYQQALAGLVDRGWLERIAGDPDRYRPTNLGREKRLEVERLTNQYFYAPWPDLKAEEQDEVVHLMTRLKEMLEAPG